MAEAAGTATIVAAGWELPEWGTLYREIKQRTWEEGPIYHPAKLKLGP